MTINNETDEVQMVHSSSKMKSLQWIFIRSGSIKDDPGYSLPQSAHYIEGVINPAGE